jgi:hypothetical protein
VRGALRAADVRSGGLIAAGAGREQPVIGASMGSRSVKLKAIPSMVARQRPVGTTFSKTGFAGTARWRTTLAPNVDGNPAADLAGEDRFGQRL